MADTAPRSATTRGAPPLGDRASQPETRGIEIVGDGERHGRASQLFAVWAAPNVSVLNFTIGATLTLVLGLEIWQAMLVILASCLLWVFPGIVATSGPAPAVAALTPASGRSTRRGSP